MQVLNRYGPTECTIDCSAYMVELSATVMSIGKPLPNCSCYVLDAHGNPVGVGIRRTNMMWTYQIEEYFRINCNIPEAFETAMKKWRGEVVAFKKSGAMPEWKRAGA